MLRKVLTVAVVMVATLAFAQESRINVVDTEAMIQKAKERTELVHETVELKEEQRAAVYEVYMWQERQVEAMKQRYKDSPKDYEGDIKYVYPKWDSTVNHKLAEILTPQQLEVWKEALK